MVQDARKIKPTFLRLDVSNIGKPDLARTIRLWNLGQPVWRHRQFVIALSCFGPEATFLPGTQATGAHQARDAILATTPSPSAQRMHDARTAVGPATGDKDWIDRFA